VADASSALRPGAFYTTLRDSTFSITVGACSHAIPAMQEEEALIAGLVFAG